MRTPQQSLTTRNRKKKIQIESTFHGSRTKKLCVFGSSSCLSPQAISNNNNKKMFSNFNCIFCSRSCAVVSFCRRQRRVLSASPYLVRRMYVFSVNILWFCFSAVSGADDVDCSAAASDCASLSLCLLYGCRRGAGRSVNEKRTEGKTSSPKNYVSSRWCAVRVFGNPDEDENEMRKNRKLFFIIIILLYSLARASIPMPNNHDKPHTSSHSICSLRTQNAAIGLAATKKIWLNQQNFCSDHIMFFRAKKMVLFLLFPRHLHYTYQSVVWNSIFSPSLR